MPAMENTVKQLNELDVACNSEVSVEVYVEPIESESDLANSVFVFAYNVNITNNSAMAIQLVNRHWKVFSGLRQLADVKGDGVIGMQPKIKSGDSFQYRSHTVIHEPTGSMHGSYTFISEDGNFFDVMINSFPLSFRDRLSLH